jgi:hypothetical protein
MASPIMVERRWPTCISLAILGLEKSTSTRRGVGAATVVRVPSVRTRFIWASTAERDTNMLTKPLGAVVVDSTSKLGYSTAAAIS